jgi:hypothetical protein
MMAAMIACPAVAGTLSRQVKIFMPRSCNTSTTRQGAHDSALGSGAFVGPLRVAGTVEGYPFLGVNCEEVSDF